MKQLLPLVYLAIVSSTLASAAVIYSTDGTATPGFFPANGTQSNSSGFHAFQFTIGAGHAGVLDQVLIPGLSSSAFTETVDILSDSSDTIGAVLDTVSISVIGDGVAHLYTGNAANHVTLTAGTKYWIEAASPSGSDFFLWLQASPIVTSREYSSFSGYFNGQPLEAFALLEADPTGTPEPATWLLSLSCVAPLALCSRYRSRRNSN